MSEMRDYAEFATALVFPYNGKKYTAPPISFEDGLRLNDIFNHGADADMDVIDLWKIALGPLWDEMLADNVPIQFVNRVGTVVLADFQYGRTYAEAWWEGDGDPKAIANLLTPPPNRASRRSKSTAGASKTP